MFKKILSRFTRRRTPERRTPPSQEFVTPEIVGAKYYIGMGSTGDDYFYLFYENPTFMNLCVSSKKRIGLNGRRVSEGGKLIKVELNPCIKGSLKEAIQNGQIIELTSRTMEEAFEEAKGYQIMPNCRVGIKEKDVSPKYRSKSKTRKTR